MSTDAHLLVELAPAQIQLFQIAALALDDGLERAAFDPFATEQIQLLQLGARLENHIDTCRGRRVDITIWSRAKDAHRITSRSVRLTFVSDTITVFQFQHTKMRATVSDALQDLC